MIALHDAGLIFPAVKPLGLSREAMIISPCEKICSVGPISGLCMGCGRNLAEIERWANYNDAERLRVMAELPARLEAMRARKAPSAAS